MRKELFRANYELLRRFVPEMLVDEPINFWLEHKDANPFENVSSERMGNNLVGITTRYFINEDSAADPSIEV